jgi:hypothetical protein
MLEELFIAPGESEIMLHGIGKLFMKKKTVNCGVSENGEFVGHEKRNIFIFKFKPSTCVRAVMRGDMPLRDLKIGFFPLYFEQPQLKRPNSDFREGQKMIDKRYRPNIKYDRAEIRMAKEQKSKSDISKRLPEE